MLDEAAMREYSHPLLPHTLGQAMSLVQKYSLMEKKGDVLDTSFFDIEHRKAFADVGVRSALRDSFIWVIAYVLFGAIVQSIPDTYMPEQTTEILFWRVNVSPLYWASKAASFGGLFYSSGMCIAMSRYYTGNVPKRAINTLFITRMAFLISISMLTFILLGLFSSYALKKDVIIQLYNWLSYIDKEIAFKMCSFLYGYLRRFLFEAGITGMVSSALSSFIPFLGIIYFRLLKQRKKDLGLA